MMERFITEAIQQSVNDVCNMAIKAKFKVGHRSEQWVAADVGGVVTECQNESLTK